LGHSEKWDQGQRRGKLREFDGSFMLKEKIFSKGGLEIIYHLDIATKNATNICVKTIMQSLQINVQGSIAEGLKPCFL
jgi:hypothetical protein